MHGNKATGDKITENVSEKSQIKCYMFVTLRVLFIYLELFFKLIHDRFSVLGDGKRTSMTEYVVMATPSEC